jgi:hypothetical protein
LILWIPARAALEANGVLEVRAVCAAGTAEEAADATPPAAVKSAASTNQMNERRITNS